MKDLIDVLPPNHFGTLMDKTLGYLKTGESVCVYGMPGCGLKHFLRMARKMLNDSGGFETVFF